MKKTLSEILRTVQNYYNTKSECYEKLCINEAIAQIRQLVPKKKLSKVIDDFFTNEYDCGYTPTVFYRKKLAKKIYHDILEA